MNPKFPQRNFKTEVALRFIWLAPILIMIALIAACGSISEKVFDNRLSEGVIEYAVSFPELGEESITATLLPETMTYEFTENSFTSHFEAAGGVFKNRINANREEMTVEHQLKVFRKKVKVIMNEPDVLQMLSEYPKMTIVKTEGTDTIAGYLCKKALVIFEEVDVPEIEIFYTEEIKMNAPNWCTQYHEIEGVLMAYEIEEFGIRMRLRAESVQPAEPNVAEKGETIGEDYASISRESMDVELAQLVETFEL